ncbi:MAG: S1 RNA-binding domain-containing protein [Bacteroidota bacterium]|jgi:predicted RNA-binding protein (virulence factor B family)
MKLGVFNELEVLRFTSVGAYLGDSSGEEVLLPNKYLNPDMKEGEMVNVFLYKDSEDRPVATTETPYINLDHFALLKVKDTGPFGAFLDWGLEKDLLVPFREQNVKLEVGGSYLVTLRYDNSTDRLYGSSKLNKYLEPCMDPTYLNKQVHLLVGDSTELGVTVIVDDRYRGLIFRNDVNRPLRKGELIEGFVYNIRQDGKLDVRLVKSEVQRYDESAATILEMLQTEKKIMVSDKTDPDAIRERFHMSKKMFKQAIGKLYKDRLIHINDDSIELVS